MKFEYGRKVLIFKKSSGPTHESTPTKIDSVPLSKIRSHAKRCGSDGRGIWGASTVSTRGMRGSSVWTRAGWAGRRHRPGSSGRFDGVHPRVPQ